MKNVPKKNQLVATRIFIVYHQFSIIWFSLSSIYLYLLMSSTQRNTFRKSLGSYQCSLFKLVPYLYTLGVIISQSGYSQSSVRILSYGLSDSCRSKRYTYRYSNKNPKKCLFVVVRRSVYLSDRVSFFTLSQLWRHKTHHEHYH